ncbi:Uncharacterised protein [Vibrio cholerae]|nr:Uncharacterised protein [Vibrio cholerae]
MPHVAQSMPLAHQYTDNLALSKPSLTRDECAQPLRACMVVLHLVDK